MLTTRANLARALDDEDTARQCEDKADLILSRLREKLWQQDLGRFAFFMDPQGIIRPDGQYHTYIYPALWNLVDDLDAWTGMRHLRESLMGEGGEVYASNNFPYHAVGTWGMQAGAAQQPWSAWGLAAVGCRNETFLPLRAVARWVMNEDHRGSWPEVSTEHTAAYFSPPAGLYVQSTIEALFGLRMNRPEKELLVKPSFPDDWPKASVQLAELSAEYRKRGGRIEYTIESTEPLARHIQWQLPPCEIKSFRINGEKIPYQLQPGVDCVVLTARSSTEEKTTIEIKLRALDLRLDAPASIAEGDRFNLSLKGAEIISVDDRCGVLASCRQPGASQLEGRIQTGLLAPYKALERLGQLSFSRRTFFLYCKADGLVEFWLPVNMTILPRVEAAPAGEIEIKQNSGSLSLLLRNNSLLPMQGQARLNLAGTSILFDIDLKGRSEETFDLTLPKDHLGMLSPGDNAASIVLPDDSCVELKFVANKLFETVPELADYAKARMVSIDLPEEALIDDDKWRSLPNFYAYGHPPWNGSKPPLQALGDKTEVSVPGLPGVPFKITSGKIAAVAWNAGRPDLRIDLYSKRYRKLYLLLVPFVDNHDTFARVGRVSVQLADANPTGQTAQRGRGFQTRELTFPGDLDWWCPREVVGDFASVPREERDRFALLPMLSPGQGLWKDMLPPEYPQPKFWATCLPLKTPSAVMNVVEIDLGGLLPVKSLWVSTIGLDPAFGLVAVTAVKGGDSKIDAPVEQWLPADRPQEPVILFDLSGPKAAEGWTFEGEAFSVSKVYESHALNSLSKAGEQSTGKAVSPVFELEGKQLNIKLQGGTSAAEEGPGALYLKLVDAQSGETLEKITPPSSHVLRRYSIDIEKWQGKKARLVLVDENTGAAFAWIGLGQVTVSD
jgi:hypothetical protein